MVRSMTTEGMPERIWAGYNEGYRMWNHGHADHIILDQGHQQYTCTSWLIERLEGMKRHEGAEFSHDFDYNAAIDAVIALVREG